MYSVEIFVSASGDAIIGIVAGSTVSNPTAPSPIVHAQSSASRRSRSIDEGKTNDKAVELLRLLHTPGKRKKREMNNLILLI